MKRIGWFTTGRGPGSLNLFNTMMDRIEAGEIRARLSFVLINRDLKGNRFRTSLVDRAQRGGIPVILYPSDTFMPELKERDIESWRAEYGKGMRERLAPHRMDFGVLAGWMLIMDPETCRRYTIINLHPALPGTYRGTWEEIIGQVVDNRDESYGAMVHLVTPELDRGQSIAYDSFPLAPFFASSGDRQELVQRIRDREVRREAHLLMAAVKAMVDGDIVVQGGEVLDRSGRPMRDPMRLSDSIDHMLEEQGK